MKRNLYLQTSRNLVNLKKYNKLYFLRFVLLNTRMSSVLKEKEALRIRSSVLVNSQVKKTFLVNRMSSLAKIKTQCLLTWRTRSVYSFFGLSRISLRELVGFGLAKGITKASW